MVLDLDVELGDVAGFFGLKSPKSLVEEDSEGSILDPATIFRSIITHSKTGIDLLSFSDGFPQKARAFAAEVKTLLGLLQAEYDYIIIDASSTLNQLVVSVLDSSHIIFLISKCNLPALRNAQRVLHGFERLGYSASRIRLLVNRYQRGQDLSLKEVEKILGFEVFWSIPNDYKSLIRSIQSGDPLNPTNQFDSPGKELLRHVCTGSRHSDRVSSQIRWRLLGASKRHSQQVDAPDHSQPIEELVRSGTVHGSPPRSS